MAKNEGNLVLRRGLGRIACHVDGAAEKYSAVKYVPPAGFAGHKQGELRFTFDLLSAEPLGVGAGWLRPQNKDVSYSCPLPGCIGPIMNGPVPGCV